MLEKINISKDKQNKWEQLFEEMLSSVEFSLVKYGRDYYGLSDNQGANLGGIEECVFQNASLIIDRLDIYIHDYFIEDIEQELKNYEINCPTDEQILNGDPYFKIQDCEWYYRLLTLLPQSDAQQGLKFIENHKFDYDVLDMILHHSDEINLENISCIETDKKIRVITVTETYSKSFMVLAENSEEAQEIIDRKWNCGDLGEMEGDDYVCDSLIIEDNTEALKYLPNDFLELVEQDED